MLSIGIGNRTGFRLEPSLIWKDLPPGLMFKVRSSAEDLGVEASGRENFLGVGKCLI